MCDFFYNFMSELRIPSISENISNATDITDSVLATINVFQDHPSIKDISANNFKSNFTLTLTKYEFKKVLEA